MDSTCDPSLTSFLDVDPASHFPIQNLPWGVISPDDEAPRCAVRIGDHTVDLSVLQEAGLLAVEDLPAGVFAQPVLNDFMALPAAIRRAVRTRLSELLRADCADLRDDKALWSMAIRPLDEVDVHLPVNIGDYTDFYSSREHATNVGIMFRGKDNALMPNWLHLPVGYHGRASSVVQSGTPVRRPRGQMVMGDSETPVYGPCRLLDFELEMGFFTAGPPTTLGDPITMDEADDRIFGMVLVNDWSARDIQKWEYQPLGPFNAKNFATSISPWIVPWEALEPFRCPAPDQNDPVPLPYLRGESRCAVDVELEVQLTTPKQTEPFKLCRSNFKYMYWTVQQQLAHHTVTGCNINPGDLLGSGTISGPDEGSYGSMLELSWRGTKPMSLPSGEERKFIQDGDTVIMTGWCQGEGYRVGFGEVTGELLPAHTD